MGSDNKDKAAPVGGRLIGALVGVFVVIAAAAAG